MSLANLVFSSTANTLKNTIRDNITITVPSGSQGAGTRNTYTESKTISEPSVNFTTLLVNQDNIAATTGGELEDTDEYLYYNGSLQLLVPATVPTAGALQEIPARLYFKVDGDNFDVTLYVENPFPDTVTRATTNITVYLYGYAPFQ